MTDNNVLQAWDRFCDELKATGNRVVDLLPDPTEEQTAEAIHFLTRILRGALDHRVDGRIPTLPHITQWDRVTAAAAPYAPNIDNTYLIALLDPDATYRLVIETATIDELIISVNEKPNSDGPPKVWGNLCLGDFEVIDGTLEITISTQPLPGNWIQMPERADWLFVRLYYFDWERGTPPPMRLTRDGVEDVRLHAIPPSDLIAGLAESVKWTEFSIIGSMEWADRFLARTPGPNECSTPEYETGAPGAIRYGGLRFQLKPDQSLIMEFDPPDAKYWIVQWHRLPWGDSADFMNHITSLNNHQATVDSDGRVRIVIAHTDPAVHNWLSTEGRDEGVVIYRWIWSGDAPVPTTKVVPSHAVRDFLPGDTAPMDAAARKRQLDMRRRHLSLRY